MSKSKFYEEIAVIKDPEGSGLVVSITKGEKANGYCAFSFSVMKEFERKRGGPVERTAFLGERHVGAAHRLIDLAAERIAEEKEKLHAKRRNQ